LIGALAVSLAFVGVAFAAPAQSPPVSTPAQSSAWKTYSYAADGFSASFPSEPALQKQSVPTDAGTFELRAYVANDGDSALYIGVCDYGSTASNTDPDAILNGARDGAVENVKGRLVSTKKITFGVYPGLNYEIESDSLHFSGRMYLVGSVLYQVVAAAPAAKPYASSSKFLDSFQLIPRPA
jgi:hypothetical protein